MHLLYISISVSVVMVLLILFGPSKYKDIFTKLFLVLLPSLLLLLLLFLYLISFSTCPEVTPESVVEVVDKSVGGTAVVSVAPVVESSWSDKIISFSVLSLFVLVDLYMTYIMPYLEAGVTPLPVFEPRIMDLSLYPEVPVQFRKGLMIVFPDTPLNLGFNYQRLPWDPLAFYPMMDLLIDIPPLGEMSFRGFVESMYLNPNPHPDLARLFVEYFIVLKHVIADPNYVLTPNHFVGIPFPQLCYLIAGLSPAELTQLSSIFPSLHPVCLYTGMPAYEVAQVVLEFQNAYGSDYAGLMHNQIYRDMLEVPRELSPSPWLSHHPRPHDLSVWCGNRR